MNRLAWPAACCTLAIFAPPVRAQVASVSGVVRDSTGPLAGVEISLPGSPLRAVTAGDGRFRLGGLPTGAVTLRARRIGYRLESVPVILGATAPGEVRVLMRAIPLELEAITIQAPRNGLSRQLEAFYERRSKGNGRFFTRRELERSQTNRMSDALRSLMPGLQVNQAGPSPRSSVRLRNARCAPLVWIDGAPASSGEFDIDVIGTSTVAAVEVYAGPATVPMEFRMNRGLDACGVIAIWSRNDYTEDVVRRTRDFERRRKEAMARADTGIVYHADEVDVAARTDETELMQPVYPDSMLAFRVPGRVVVEFIVEENGVVNAGSVAMVSSTHPDFFEAVKNALLASRFVPAKRQGRAVRQVMILPFDFRPDSIANGAP